MRASRTPGKTKTLQTIYWNQHIRLCDCPGLVCPSSAGLERQVLAGILPIQNIEPVLRFIGQRIPLEHVLKLKHDDDDDEQEKRRDEFSLDPNPTTATDTKGRWTTDELLAAYADQQGEFKIRKESSRHLVSAKNLDFELKASSRRKLVAPTFTARGRSFCANCTRL